MGPAFDRAQSLYDAMEPPEDDEDDSDDEEED